MCTEEEQDTIVIDSKKVAEVAKLARLQIDDSQLEGIAEDLKKILRFCKKIANEDLEGVGPTVSLITDTGTGQKWRKDEVSDGGYPNRILANAPEAREGFFVVPKVV